jgi:hypothetical protein
MPKNKIDDLRDHLFETLEALKDDEKPMELDRAREIANVARAIVETAKVEIDFARVMNDSTGEFRGSSFLPAPEPGDAPKQLAAVAGRARR